MVEPFRPNETLLELLKVSAVRLLDVVPALITNGAEAVIVEPLRPNVTLFELEKVIAERF